MRRFWLGGLFFYLLLVALVSSGRAAVSSPSPSPSPSTGCMSTAPLFLLREALPFCGGKVDSPTCCTLDDDANLHREFLDEIIKRHDYYHDPQCISTLKATICAVCLPSAPVAAEPFSNDTTTTINNSSLPLQCAAPSVSIHDLTSPSAEPPIPTPEWLLADDDKDSDTKMLIALISSLVALLGGFITYKICKARLECCNDNQCCSNINCC